MPLERVCQDVREFHRVFSHPIGEAPRMLPPERAKARAEWITSEADELLDAGTIFEQADAFIDAIYFAIGGLVDMGIDPSPIWSLVQAANMAKVQPDGSVKRRESDGKILKPDGWVPPDAAIYDEIMRQMAAAQERK